MRKNVLILFVSLFIFDAHSQWNPAGERIKTKWAEEIDPNNVLPEYPRPIMERKDWMNLNGLWDYSITPIGQDKASSFDGKILVPFAIESSLSGVQKEVGENNILWYQRMFTVPEKWKGKDVLLHFGAVDWKTEVFLNDIKVGTHTGGYTPFSFNITPFLKSGKQELTIKVWDGTEKSFQPRGKQLSTPKGIWYTSVTGIWQTVWLEPVNPKHIDNIKTTSDIDKNQLTIDVDVENFVNSDIIEVIVFDKKVKIASSKAAIGQTIELKIPDMKLWSPEVPFLYDLQINLYNSGKLVDRVNSYTAMRKISAKRDKNGIVRMQLNNKDYFHFGTLDQGWWPDGLYTAPTDEALLFDIKKTKDFGFNMIRKHVKVEPARWYTHCDQMGMIVWQDMPNGDKLHDWQQFDYFKGSELIISPEAKKNFRKEWKEVVDYLYSYPSIAVWVPFNEAWGQFDTEEISNWTKQYDPSRLVNAASGGNFYRTGDILDLHNYPGPAMFLYDAERVNVLGEYGGIGLPIEGHLWKPDNNWGYIQFKDSKEVTDEYIKYAKELKNMIRSGFSGAIYTQITDVEIEVNGLITYDRKIVKIDEERIRKMNQEICNSLNE